MDVNLAREIVTVASFLVFIGIVAWAASPGNRRRFDEAARLPLDDDEPTLTPGLTLSPTLSQGRGGKRGTRFREMEAHEDE